MFVFVILYINIVNVNFGDITENKILYQGCCLSLGLSLGLGLSLSLGLSLGLGLSLISLGEAMANSQWLQPLE